MFNFINLLILTIFNINGMKPEVFNNVEKLIFDNISFNITNIENIPNIKKTNSINDYLNTLVVDTIFLEEDEYAIKIIPLLIKKNPFFKMSFTIKVHVDNFIKLIGILLHFYFYVNLDIKKISIYYENQLNNFSNITTFSFSNLKCLNFYLGNNITDYEYFFNKILPEINFEFWILFILHLNYETYKELVKYISLEKCLDYCEWDWNIISKTIDTEEVFKSLEIKNNEQILKIKDIYCTININIDTENIKDSYDDISMRFVDFVSIKSNVYIIYFHSYVNKICFEIKVEKKNISRLVKHLYSMYIYYNTKKKENNPISLSHTSIYFDNIYIFHFQEQIINSIKLNIGDNIQNYIYFLKEGINDFSGIKKIFFIFSDYKRLVALRKNDNFQRALSICNLDLNLNLLGVVLKNNDNEVWSLLSNGFIEDYQSRIKKYDIETLQFNVPPKIHFRKQV
jgi:hypothetical protein